MRPCRLSPFPGVTAQDGFADFAGEVGRGVALVEVVHHFVLADNLDLAALLQDGPDFVYIAVGFDHGDVRL